MSFHHAEPDTEVQAGVKCWL